MNRYKKSLMLLLAIVGSVSILSAQDLEGIEYYTVAMTHDEIVAKFGQPTDYETYISELNEKVETYYYGKNVINFFDGFLGEFYIFDDTFSALKNFIPGGIRVGEPISLLFGNEKVNPQIAYWISDDEYYAFPEIDSIVFTMSTKGGIITNIVMHLRP